MAYLWSWQPCARRCRHEGMRAYQHGWLCRWTIAAALLATVPLTLVAGCGAPAGNTRSASPALSTAGRTDPASSTTAALVTVNLPVVSCPTSLGVVHPAVSLPSSRPVAVPRALAARLAVYADDVGVMELVGPKGWSCAASYGADGSGGLVVFPRGERVSPSWAAGWPLARTSTEAAIAGLESSACYSCTLAQACRLFPSAATAWRSAGFGRACPARPAAESVVRVGAGIVIFEDPPGIQGDGLPSGGLYPANGVLTYHPGAPDGSWRETCTLPGSAKDECTALLNAFLSWYGQR
jgi:hypothetical protein